MNDSCVVVGAGQAGANAVRAMRTSGFKGRIVLVGDEPHLPYERPPLSKEFLQSGPLPPTPSVLDAQFYSQNAVELRLGQAAVGLDRSAGLVSLSDNSTVSYDRLLLATGGSPRKLAIEGAERCGIFYLRTLDDSLALRASLLKGACVLIIGGGFVGLEVAACAATCGCRAVIVEAGPVLMTRMQCPAVSDHVASHHRSRGIEIQLGVRPVLIESLGGGYSVVLSSGEKLRADVIVIGIGIEPEVELARQAGLDLDNGVITDEYGVTSDPSIFAAGDVTNHFNPLLRRRVRLESWQNAQSQANAAGQGMAGHPVVYGEVPWVWSDQGELKLQFAGALEKVDEIVLRGEPVSGAFTALLFRGARLGGAITVNQDKEMVYIRRMLASGIDFTPADFRDSRVGLRQLIRDARVGSGA